MFFISRYVFSYREKHMGSCHIEGKGRSLRGGFDDLLTTCMECPGTPDGEAIAGPPDPPPH